VAEDSFKKIRKGAKQAGRGAEDTSEGTIEAAEGILGGLKETAESVIEGVKDTVVGVKEGVEETADVFEDTTIQATRADTYKSRRTVKSRRKGTKKS
jgi:hypothetical protein